MTKAKEVASKIEALAPPAYQESYDNAGWMCGDPEKEVSSVLVAVDMTMEVLDEAIRNGDSLIITHHPLIFMPLRNLTAGNMINDILLKAVRNGIAIYAAHTNLDNSREGVNRRLADVLGLQNFKILKPSSDILKKLVVFVPEDHAERVRKAMFEAGAGKIGEYDSCSYNIRGEGSFRAGENADPFVGEKARLHYEPEQRIETIVPLHLVTKAVKAAINVHPYEEVAYDIYPLENVHEGIGAGGLGELIEGLDHEQFMDMVKEKLGAKVIRYSGSKPSKIKKVALAAGAGSFLIQDAIHSGADVFLTADLKYHDFFMAENKILLADAGHYETEQFTKHLIRDVLIENFSNFATRISEVNTNPVNYY